MTKRAPLLVVLAAAMAALAGCGSSASANGPLSDAGSGLGKVKRGTMFFRMTAGAGEAPGASGHDVGFQLQGPFDLSPPKSDPLPVAKLQLTQMLGGQDRTMTFVSTGQQAFVEAGGKTTQLTDAQVRSLRLDRNAKQQGDLGLHVARWSAHAQESDGGIVDGVAARRLTAAVDPVPALNELLGLAGQLGVPGRGQPIAGQEADGLRKLTRSAQLDVLVGKQDGLVRSLRLQFVFAADASQQLRSALGDLAAARLGVELRVDRPNQPIPPVTAPVAAAP